MMEGGVASMIDSIVERLTAENHALRLELADQKEVALRLIAENQTLRKERDAQQVQLRRQQEHINRLVQAIRVMVEAGSEVLRVQVGGDAPMDRKAHLNAMTMLADMAGEYDVEGE